ncbi:PQQ-dependent sugar dehydrogenase [Stakelama tenebrarum]|uniref:PQQ-dependent sugar dehydrogenase n=1 Tax=Stakelama tenebrarum TaxID=2711215 RepID=A0A6G6Y1X0_9SPHN|nr:PQQ-dependent sugar dehydrogenase [Sphingosinithalassobacter tenebrarum]QIG78807.1 PQQ-dependent sugar dehydrogenase [Sphingosinithalassobacter tenebrarum]
MRRTATGLIAATAFTLIACSAQPPGQGGATPGPDAAMLQSGRPFTIATVADFESPWAMAFLPGGRMLVTEKAGSLWLLSSDGQTRSEVTDIPAVDNDGQGGLMDVVLHPDFEANRLVYFSFSESGPGGKGVVLARGRLDEEGGSARLADVERLFQATPYVSGDGHYSGRIAFSPDGQYLFFTNGDRQKFDPAQDPRSTLGKVLRLTPDGEPAPGNPLAEKGFHPAIWSYGHRNLLGIAFDSSGALWEVEMGPRGGDEVNRIEAGRNYGWPLVSNGDHYSGETIPDHDTRRDLTAPVASWNPSISPAGLIVYSGKLWPQWKDDLFLGALSGKALIRVEVNPASAPRIEQWDMDTRIRDVAEGPDGAIWLLEDGRRGAAGKLMRLTPAE